MRKDRSLKEIEFLNRRIIKAVGSVVSLTDENENFGEYAYVLRKLPIESLESVRAALKSELGKDYDCVRVKYRGPRPALRLPPTEDNLLKIIALGKNAYRTREMRNSDCLKHNATGYSLYN